MYEEADIRVIFSARAGLRENHVWVNWSSTSGAAKSAKLEERAAMGYIVHLKRCFSWDLSGPGRRDEQGDDERKEERYR